MAEELQTTRAVRIRKSQMRKYKDLNEREIVSKIMKGERIAGAIVGTCLTGMAALWVWIFIVASR
jgi:hypothetical protein